MTISKEIIHKDKLGRVLKVGDAVVFPIHNNLGIGTVKKLNPKMVKVLEFGHTESRYHSGNNKYPSDIVVVEGPEVTLFLLRANSKK